MGSQEEDLHGQSISHPLWVSGSIPIQTQPGPRPCGTYWELHYPGEAWAEAHGQVRRHGHEGQHTKMRKRPHVHGITWK